MQQWMRLALAVVTLTCLTLVAGCSRSADATEVVPPDEAIAAIEDGARVIDVRTPAEFDDGHLPEATNIDLSAPDFEERLGDLDPQGSYVVYCRTGNRSAQAIEIMLDMGFDDVVNGGGYDALAAERG